MGEGAAPRRCRAVSRERLRAHGHRADPLLVRRLTCYRSRVRVLVVAVLAAAGCNQIYGLHDTQQRPVDAAPDASTGCWNDSLPKTDDEDMDGKPDGCDNCPAVAN